ncbi:MAG: cysteine desulfurase NifS, cysteine desulfurase [candidate division WS6 bacterium GW2011_GWC1_33_20]|uniref:Cysteine desulfurase IscS n=1 Tax=candidate division WS6 bacterium GW2011_GWC1_33_20 TaxID=1619089 RepID=A0A0F9ZIC6_9BACT|nr:MAG: cysteine desulfurase NifS, cysteine desulfurase [candidate division WS6 bacterium GW2011_GWE2_33_157]KKP43953.1 MAG: cysteine desulfurase NifS, cysteine desulfurase [candidate division WS6 bacterium GW2011_GWC1_33_20]KKP45682.1 MAG: cysteine desulfurase NifS, cysteine desulfurase [candidate division WS6 bacterium GW2011_GWF1_33_233]KKP55057.1 MAG: cysteine desulfurase NifS, cysteine desulfurase [candidate division WS6 bacterium GW2011_WS6_33_547]KKP82205.1 MAG: Cysteine desulfurase [can
MNRIIYLDNAATTRLNPKVLDSMLPYLKESYGNPSSIHFLGRENKKAIDKAREQVAKSLNAQFNEIFFTGGGSESDNWAIKGVAFANESKGKHIITTNIEHHAVLHTCKYLEKYGFEITYLPVKSNGIIDIEDLKKAIREDTILISVMFANNEIGTIQPIKEIGEIAREKGIYFHTDAVQAIGHIPIDVKELNIDLLSLSAHKFNGPKGVGVLYIKSGVNILSMIHGGGQERGKRAGTENVAGIVGLGEAIEIATKDIEKKSKYLITLRDRTIKELINRIPDTILNGDPKKRLPGNINVCFKYIEGESILLMLDMKGLAASSGSACTSGSLKPSHVLLAIGLPHEIAHGSLRLTLSEETTDKDMEYLLEVLPPIVENLRKMSPLIKNK